MYTFSGTCHIKHQIQPNAKLEQYFNSTVIKHHTWQGISSINR